MMPVTPSPHRSSPQKAFPFGALAGIGLSAGGVLTALRLQGGEPADLFQWSSAVLLLAGTGGAVLMTTPLAFVREAWESLGSLFAPGAPDSTAAVTLLMGLSKKAKRLGLPALEAELDTIPIPLLHEAVRMASDGCTVDEVGNMMRLETRLTQKRVDRQACVFEAAAGYAPTLGILGAVLGLIQVMKHLGEMAVVGHGIAAAFVSTVYGLALANLVLLPMAGRMRASGSQRIEAQELLTEGVICVMQQAHPMLMEARLAPYLTRARGDGTRPQRAAGETPKIALAKGA